jgi:hypothetical protein
MGFGKKMMKIAEDISMWRGFRKVAVISGVGVREYYASQDYKLVKDYMIKELKEETTPNYPFSTTFGTPLADMKGWGEDILYLLMVFILIISILIFI